MKKKKLSKKFEGKIFNFLDTVPVKRLNRHLRFMLLAYLSEHRGGTPLYHDDLVFDLEFLFYMLDAAEEEQAIESPQSTVDSPQ
jgi:hypothetical protein